MHATLLTVEIRHEHDVVLTRQRARQVTQALGFDAHEQTRLATAVSEIARNAFRHAGGGRAEFLLEGDPAAALVVRVSDNGPGIPDVRAVLDGRQAGAGGGMGLISARRLVDDLRIDSRVGKGTTVLLRLELAAPRPLAGLTAAVSAALAGRTPGGVVEELQQQNQDLLRTLEELRRRQAEVERLNRELEETNRGVLALYAELDEKADDLRKASDLKTRFLSHMTHELRTPLNSILMLSRLLLDGTDGALADLQRKPVELIQRSAASLLELVNDLLDLAKIEAGRIEIKPAWFEIGELFGTLRGMFRPLAAQAGLSLLLEEPPAGLRLYSDEEKLSQILRNLIANAIKFTRQGRVRVAVESQPPDTVVFEVQDTGIGISPEDQGRLFEDFRQLAVPDEIKAKGTGLGLSLSRRLAELLGGRIYLESQVSVGSRFFVAVPRVFSPPASTEPEDDLAEPAVEGEEARHG